MTDSASRMKQAWMPACIVLIAVILRCLYLVEASHSPEFSHPIYDPEYNAYWARALATGDWTVPPGTPDPEIRTTPHGRPPGYPWFLAGVYKLFGVNDFTPRIIQMGIGVINALLLYFIGRKVFGATAGFLAGMFMASYWVFPYFEGLLTYPAVAVFLLLALILTLLRWQDTLKLWRTILFGVLIGGFALFRPNGLLMLPFLLAWMAWLCRRRRLSFRKTAASLFLAVFACVCMIAPPFIRNYIVARDVVFLSSYGGINLYVGNHPEASLVEPHIPELMEIAGIEHWSCFDYPAIVRGLAAAQGKESIKYSEANRYFYRKAFTFIKEDPGRFLRNLVQKTLLLFGPYEITNDTVMEYDKRYSKVLGRLPGFPWVLAFFLFGLSVFLADIPARMRDKRDRVLTAGALLLFIFCSYAFSVVIYFVAGRYRVPLIPVMLLFAAFGVTRLVDWFRHRRWKSVLAGLAILMILVLLAHHDFTGYKPSPGTWHLRRAMAYTAGGNVTRARESYQRALDCGSQSSVIFANLGRLHFENGETQAGIDMYQGCLARNPNNAMIRNNLGYELYKIGRLEEAVEHLEQAVRINPRFVLAHINLGNALADQGNTERALYHFREAARLDPKNPAGPYNTARMLFERGDLDGAITQYLRALEINPAYASALNNLGYCHEVRGAHEEALAFYRRAVEADPSFVLARNNLGNALLELGQAEEARNVYAEALDMDPKNAFTRYNLGRAFLALDDLENARAQLQQALNLNPDFAPTLYQLGILYLKGSEAGNAVEVLEKAAALSPNDEDIRTLLEKARDIVATVHPPEE